MSATAGVQRARPSPRADDRRVRSGRRPGRARRPWLVGVVVAAGVVLRLVVLFGPLGRPDSDEVIAGLIARHLGSDGLPAFYWGQHYGGTIEALPVALSLKLFGTSVAALRVPTLAARGGQRRAGLAVRSPGDGRGQRAGGRPARLGVAAGGRLVRRHARCSSTPRRSRSASPRCCWPSASGPPTVTAVAGALVVRRVGRSRRRARLRLVDQPQHVLLRGAGRGGAAAPAGSVRTGRRAAVAGGPRRRVRRRR